MSKAKKSANNDTVGCGCLLLIIIVLVFTACTALAGGGEPSAPLLPALTPTPSATKASAEPTRAETSTPPRKDMDDDGVADRVDNDADGDGVSKRRDVDDEDPKKGAKPKPRPKPEPRPDPEPEPVSAHPGGFCGSPGAVGVASNGRTYTCRDGHWRR